MKRKDLRHNIQNDLFSLIYICEKKENHLKNHKDL